MKRILLLLLIFVFIQNAYCQEKDELPYATLHFVRSNTFRGSLCRSEIVFKNQKAFNLSSNSLVDYKMYSSGGTYITCEIICPSTQYSPAHSVSNQIQIEVESGKEYYLLFDFYKREGLMLKAVEKSEVEALLSKITNIQFFEEDIANPINKESFVDVNKRNKFSQGSGFLVNDDGYVLTSFHVVENAQQVSITGIKGDFSISFPALVIAVDRLADLALLKIDTKIITFENPPYTLFESKKVKKAERIYALGYPMENAMGKEAKITDGIINSLTGFQQSISEFQISAAVQGGNSGGPLFNSNGQVIGVVSGKIRSDVADQVGYALKSDYVQYFLDQSGITQFNLSDSTLTGKSLSEQVDALSNFIYLIKTE